MRKGGRESLFYWIGRDDRKNRKVREVEKVFLDRKETEKRR